MAKKKKKFNLLKIVMYNSNNNWFVIKEKYCHVFVSHNKYCIQLYTDYVFVSHAK